MEKYWFLVEIPFDFDYTRHLHFYGTEKELIAKASRDGCWRNPNTTYPHLECVQLLTNGEELERSDILAKLFKPYKLSIDNIVGLTDIKPVSVSDILPKFNCSEFLIRKTVEDSVGNQYVDIGLKTEMPIFSFETNEQLPCEEKVHWVLALHFYNKNRRRPLYLS